jgi:nucleoside-diphosphate-sugar epimerase
VSRVLLTGAGGFVGAAALEALVRGEHEVHAVSSRRREDTAEVVWHAADLLDAGATDELVRRVRPELLLHLAWFSDHGRFWTSPENVRWVEATLRLLRTFAEHGGRRAALAGTCAEYDWSAEDAICSERVTPLRPATLYGVSKNATREVAEAFSGEAGFELAWGRVFFLYGPGEADTRLVPAVARALLEGMPASVSDGSQVRDFLHVDDVGRAFVALLGSNVAGAVNIGSGSGVEVREVINLIGSATGRPDLIQFGAVATRPGEPATLVADVSRLRDEVGFTPRIALTEGIRETVAWWQERIRGATAEAG